MPLNDPVRSSRAVAIAGIVALVLQVALAPQISVFGGRINFMLAFAAAVALSGDANGAVWAGFIGGLLYDLTSTAPVGLMTLIMTVGTFVLASAIGMAGEGLSARSMQFVLIYALAVCFVNGLCLFFMGLEHSLLNALLVRGLASALVSTLAAAGFVFAFGRTETRTRGFSARGRGTRFKGPR